MNNEDDPNLVPPVEPPTEPSGVEEDWAAALAKQAEEQDNEKEIQKQASSGDDDWGAALQEQMHGKQSSKRAEFEEFKMPSEEHPARTLTELDVILDIPVTIAMEVGSTLISIRNLLKLNQGSVIELDRLAGEPLDVLVNGTLIAHGEVVVVNEKFGIRLTDVMSAAERIEKIQ